MDGSFREVDGAGTEDNGAQPTDELIAENPDMDAATKNLVQRAFETETTLDHKCVARGRVQNIGFNFLIEERKQCADTAGGAHKKFHHFHHVVLSTHHGEFAKNLGQKPYLETDSSDILLTQCQND